MKYTILLAIIFNFPLNISAQKKHSISTYLKVNNVPFLANKQRILKVFGKPVKQFLPHYECGFLSDSEQGNKFHTLQYNQIKWTGNDKDGYLMENLNVTPDSKYVIIYKGKIISHHITKKEFIKLTGATDKNTQADLANKGSGDKFIFYFLKRKLVRIEYWSPC